MNYKALIIESGKRMLHSGLTVETWGNISARDPESGRIYITPSGMDYDRCAEDDVVVFDMNGAVVEGRRVPSIESELHLFVYQARREINAVVHTHPLYSMVFACLAEDIPLMMDEAAQTLGDVVRVSEYALPGSHELAVKCVTALGEKSRACLLQSHGAVCAGESMDMAFKVAKVLEMTARVYYMTRSIGTPKMLSEENIQAMQAFVKTKYGQVP